MILTSTATTLIVDCNARSGDNSILYISRSCIKRVELIDNSLKGTYVRLVYTGDKAIELDMDDNRGAPVELDAATPADNAALAIALAALIL